MRKFALAILACFAVINTWAGTVYLDSHYWDFTVINGYATIDRVRYVFSSGSSNPITIPSSLNGYPVAHIGSGAFMSLQTSRVTIPDGVISIGSSAFFDCYNLRVVSVPDSVKSIGRGAFNGCHASLFDTATIPGVKIVDGWAYGFTSDMTGDVDLTGVRGVAESAFSGSDGLTSVTIPSNVTIVGSSTFENCSNLLSVTMAGAVTRIGDYAFQNCSNLTNLIVPDSMMSIGYNAFSGCNEALFDLVTIPGVRLLGGWAVDYTDSMPANLDLAGACGMARKLFYGCSVLKSIKMPDGMMNIDDSVFYGSGLMSAILPNGLTNISGSAFYGCSSLASIKIPDSVTRIGDSAFYGCNGLMSVQIGNGVMEIGKNAFYGCSGFSSITIPGSVTNIGTSAFYNCSGMTGVRMSDGVRDIGSMAFYNCGGLTSVTIPGSVTKIGTNAFYNCSGLTSVMIGEGVQVICDRAFQGCNKLTNVTIPNSAEKIGDGAFIGCTKLNSISLPFVGSERGNSGVANALFGYVFGTNSFSAAIAQYYSSSESMAYCIPASLRSVVITDETLLGYGAFYGCNTLTNLVVNQGIGQIGDNAFYNCNGLVEFMIPNSVTLIGASAFARCSSLTEIVVPNDVLLIGRGAFSDCRRLEKITLPFVGSTRGNEDTADSLFGHIFGTASYSGGVATTQYFAPYEYATYYIPASLKSVVITDETLLGYGAFYGCFGIVDVSLSESVEAIGVSAFSGCENLESIIFQGDAPVATSESFDGIPDSCKGCVVYGSDGWGESVPCQWNGLAIEYISTIVVFDANGGTGGAELELAVGAEIVAPTVERTGYSFAGWAPSVDEIVPSTNVTYVAQWEADDFEVSFDAAGGVLSNCNSKIVRYDEAYGELLTPTREGYAFSGWTLNGSLVTATTIMTTASDHSLVAQWTPERYVVTFNANGGIGGCAGYHDYASAIVAPTVTRTGYSFVEWWPNVAATVPRSNVTYTAQWTANVYSVRFDANGGDGEMVDVEMTYDEAFPLSTNVFTRQDYAFMGWSRSSDGSVEFEDSQSISNLTMDAGGIVTLYAVWESTKVANPVISAAGGPMFLGDSCEVSITCETEGATIYYSPKGATPRQTSAYLYTGPFTITNTATIKAIAVKGSRKSDYVTLTVEKVSLTLAGAAGADGLVFSTGGAANWVPIIDATSESGFSAQSGMIGLESETWMETTVEGAGTLAFKWKVDCEWDESGDATWDSLAVFTNGVEVARIDGATDWASVSFAFEDGGSQVIRWVFSKDDYDEEGAGYADCAWVSGAVWTPSGEIPAIPAVAADASAAIVNATVDGVGFADAAVKAAIDGSAAEYTAFKTWADAVKGVTGDTLAGEAAVVANAYAAAAYLLGAERLFENEPMVEIGALEIADGASEGTMVVSVTVKDGENVVVVNAAKVAGMFEATSDLADWNGAAKMDVGVEVLEDAAGGGVTTPDASMRFAVSPRDNASTKAFLRIRKE